MSVKLMSAIFESTNLRPTERLLMLSLADHANDEGHCYPSIARLCKRTGLSERAVQTNIKSLIEGGYLKVIVGGGKGNANAYWVRSNPAADAPYKAPKPRRKCTPQEMHPAADAPQTPQQMRANPAADAPEPSRTIIGTVIGGDGSAREAEILHDQTEREDLLTAMGHHPTGITANGRIVGNAGDMAERNRWSDLGLSHSQQIDVISEVMARKRDGPPLSFKYFTDAMRRRAADLASPQLTPEFGGKNDQHSHRKSARGDAASDTALRAIAAAVRSRSAQGMDRG